MGRPPKPIAFVTMDNGCVIQTSHALNPDGYFRKSIEGKPVMYHRYIWELTNGMIPEGYEIDHMCKNRACCNIAHLQMLTVTEHRSKDNGMRYANRKAKAKVIWLSDSTITGTELGAMFNVTWSSGYNWIREWIKENK